MSAEISFCTRDELRRQVRIAKWVDSWRDEVVAFDQGPAAPIVISGVCPHFGGEIDLREGYLRCRWHGWRFDAVSGQCLSYPIKGCIRFFTSEWRGHDLVVHAPA